jgi:hypothetical protein
MHCKRSTKLVNENKGGLYTKSSKVIPRSESAGFPILLFDEVCVSTILSTSELLVDAGWLVMILSTSELLVDAGWLVSLL